MKAARITSVILIALLFCTQATAQNNTSALMPIPESITQCHEGKTFQLKESTAIYCNIPGDTFLVNELSRCILKRTGLKPITCTKQRKKNRISLLIDSTLQGSEHYTLKVNKDGISISGSTKSAAAFYHSPSILRSLRNSRVMSPRPARPTTV